MCESSGRGQCRDIQRDIVRPRPHFTVTLRSTCPMRDRNRVESRQPGATRTTTRWQSMYQRSAAAGSAWSFPRNGLPGKAPQQSVISQFVTGSKIGDIDDAAGSTLRPAQMAALPRGMLSTGCGGLFGTFIGVPIALAVVTLCDQHPSSRWLADVLGKPAQARRVTLRELARWCHPSPREWIGIGRCPPRVVMTPGFAGVRRRARRPWCAVPGRRLPCAWSPRFRAP